MYLNECNNDENLSSTAAKQLIVAKSAAAVKEEKHKRNYLLVSGIKITFLFIIYALNTS
jgi:hypothetical protein